MIYNTLKTKNRESLKYFYIFPVFSICYNDARIKEYSGIFLYFGWFHIVAQWKIKNV